MKKSIGCFIVAFALLLTCVSCGSSSSGGGGGSTFTLESSDITSGGTIGDTYAENTCTGGNNTQPDLEWTNSPAGALSYAITLIDQDAATFIHWILYNIPDTETHMTTDSGTPTGATTVTNGFLTNGYGGPCPNIGDTHTYTFTVYALDVADATGIVGFDDSSNAAFIASINANVLDTATFSGSYTGK